MFYIVSGTEYKELDPSGYFTNDQAIAQNVAFRPISNYHYETSLVSVV